LFPVDPVADVLKADDDGVKTEAGGDPLVAGERVPDAAKHDDAKSGEVGARRVARLFLTLSTQNGENIPNCN
jgi:hypothetical protein